MFTTGPLPVDGVEPGSTLLVVGPPMTGKRDLVLELLAEGFDEQGVAVVSTDESAADIRASLAGYAGRPGEDLPLGVVDCVGDSHGTEGLGPLDSRVSSPADLTGIGMELTNTLERLYADHSRQLRLGLLSLTTMSMYAEPEQVVRFLHAVTGRVDDANAFGLVVAHSDPMAEEHLQRLRSFVDGAIEVREGESGTELRVRGIPGGGSEWTPFTRGRAPGSDFEAPDKAYPDDIEVADSLRAIFDDVQAEAPTLTVCNYDGPDAELDTVEQYFTRQGIDVREASLSVDQPHSVAMLHHGDNLLGSETVTALCGAIDMERAADGEFGTRHSSDLLRSLERSVFGARAADKPLLIDVSHTVELLAHRTGTGRVHAGFQRLSNLVDDDQAARIYRKLSESGVEVHVYGTPDTETTLPGVTVHENESDEIRGSWFVTFDGAGDTDRQAALLAIENDDGTFEGFWTYDSNIVGRIDAYLTETYLAGSAVGEQSAD